MTIKIKHKPRGRKIKTLKGSIIKEYKDFYLMQALHYKTCINKRSLIDGETEMELVE